MELKTLFDKKEKEIGNIEVPKVQFEDDAMQINIAKWLGGIFDNKKYFKNKSYRDYSYLEDEEIFKVVKNKDEMQHEIAIKMGTILRLTGIDIHETCFLNNFNKDNLTFDCFLVNGYRNIKIKLTRGDWLEYLPEIIIEDRDMTKQYEYLKKDDGTVNLDLCRLDINRKKNKLNHQYFSSFARFILNNGINKLTIEVKNPDGLVYDRNYVLNNEDKLIEYLLSLDLPRDINDIYKNICQITGIDMKTIPNITISDELENNTINLLSLNYGLLDKYIVTKNEKKIMIDKDNNWVYDTDTVMISENNEGLINYNLKDINIDVIRDSSVLLSHYEVAKAYIKDTKEKVKVLTKKR